MKGPHRCIIRCSVGMKVDQGSWSQNQEFANISALH